MGPEDFQKACASIIFHLVQGYCIEEGHEHNKTSTSTLPSKEFFIDYLFEGQNYMSEDDLEEIVTSLGIGKKSVSSKTESESDGHNHRRKRSVNNQQGLRRHQEVIRRRAVDDGHGHDDDHGHDHDHRNEENKSNDSVSNFIGNVLVLNSILQNKMALLLSGCLIIGSSSLLCNVFHL